MASRIKSFRPAPDYDLNAPTKDPPTEGALPLGSIIPAKDKPKRRLNRRSRVAIPNEDIFSNTKKKYNVSSQQIKERSGSVWTSFLASAGLPASLNLHAASHASEEYLITCASMETSWFQPDHKYIFDSLQDPSIQAFGRSQFWVKPVYMVTGVKVARGISIESLEQAGAAIGARANANARPAGVDAEGGAGGAAVREATQAVEWKESDDFVFAYSLIKIKRKRDGTFTEEDVTKGGLFSTDTDRKQEETVENLTDIWDLASDGEDGVFAEEVEAESQTD